VIDDTGTDAMKVSGTYTITRIKMLLT